MIGECIIDGCDRRSSRRRMCTKHYSRWYRHGDSSVTLRASSPKGSSIENRFWAKVDKSGDCWIWTASVFKERLGYGKFQSGASRSEARAAYAHRVSWEMANGPVPDGMLVLHHCDNPPCVRPDHLFVGTHQDNMIDMMAKGRGRNQFQRKTS